MNIRAAILLGLSFVALSSAAPPAHWVVTWGASPSPQLADEEQMRTAKLVFENQTLREIVHTSIAADTIRVRLSNAFGKQEVKIGAAHIALRANGSDIVLSSDHVLTFGGRPDVVIPTDAIVVSDPVELKIPASTDVAISLFLPKIVLGAGIHYSAEQTSFVVHGDASGAPSLQNPTPLKSWIFLACLDAAAAPSGATLAAFGDSITDGAHSTLDANHRWPNILADRLLAQKHNEIGVLNAGIGGNRILHNAAKTVQFGISALARFDRDVLAQPGVKYIILLEGINDLGHAGSSAPVSETVSAEDLIAGMKQLIARAHENGLKIYGGTITPFEGTVFPGYFTPEKETKRKAVNRWIRTGNAFDGVIDFEKAVRDPNHPDRMLAAYDSGDHLHPSDAGYQVMAEAVKLSLFQ